MVNGLGSRVHRWLSWIVLPPLVCFATLEYTLPSKSQSEGLSHPRSSSIDAMSTDSGTKPFRIDVNLVQVPVVVADATNHPVIGLEKNNFALYENGEQQEIEYFSAEDSPISVGLLLDLSRSMANKFDAERSAVSEFFKNANSQDDYFVVTFSSHPEILTGATQSIGTIQAKLDTATPHGGTALLDAISVAMTRMRAARYKRQALLIISDGGENNSHHKYREIINLVRDSDVEVYAIGLFDTIFFKTFEEFMGKKWLGEITDSTGGRTVPVDRIAKMAEAAATVSRELRNQYLLGYRPSNSASDGKRRQIKVRVTDSTNPVQLQAYYKRGYVIPKEK